MYQTFNCEEKYENEQIQMNIYLRVKVHIQVYK